MNAFVKKMSIRQVATLSSLVILALSLPIGLYLTRQVQDLRQQATEIFPVTPPITPPLSCVIPSCSNGIPVTEMSSQSNSCPNTWCIPMQSPWPTMTPMPWPSPAPNPDNTITDDVYIYSASFKLYDDNNQEIDPYNLALNHSYRYSLTVYVNNRFKTSNPPLNFPISANLYLNDWNFNGKSTDFLTLASNFSGLTAINMDGQISFQYPFNTIRVIIETDWSFIDTYHQNNYWIKDIIIGYPNHAPSPSPSVSPSPTLNNTYDINNDGIINITDYTLFIAGFINSFLN